MSVLTTDSSTTYPPFSSEELGFALTFFGLSTVAIFLLLIPTVSILAHFVRNRDSEAKQRDAFLFLIMCQCSLDVLFYSIWCCNIVVWAVTHNSPAAVGMCLASAYINSFTQWLVASVIALMAHERMQLMVYEIRVEFASVVRSFVVLGVVLGVLAALPLMTRSAGSFSVYAGGAACFVTLSWNVDVFMALAVIGVTLNLTGYFYLQIYNHISKAAEAVANNTKQGQQRLVYFQLALIFTMFALAWVPFFINSMIAIITDTSQPDVASFFNMFTIVAHSLFNACLFTFKNPMVGDEIILTFPCLAGWVTAGALSRATITPVTPTTKGSSRASTSVEAMVHV